MKTNVNMVGPVLQKSELAFVIVEALKELNTQIEVTDRGGYIRVEAPEECILTKEALQTRMTGPCDFPSVLELAMTAFQGKIFMDEEIIRWSHEK